MNENMAYIVKETKDVKTEKIKIEKFPLVYYNND